MVLHQSVLLHEAIEGLAINADGIYVDATFGRGGHSHAILQRLSEVGKLIAIDKDHEAIEYAQKYFEGESRFSIYCASFAKLIELTKQADVFGRVNGILLDLGVSSPQLDNPGRGFSFVHDGPLDMRMDHSQGLSASQFINEAEEDEMADIFKTYGEERFAKRIARAIASARQISPISTTQALSEIVKQANPKWEKNKHPATRVFQAIRIYVNQELQDLNSALEGVIECLAPGGRLVVISFHSLEDRIVKQFMRRSRTEKALIPKEIPIRYEKKEESFKQIGKPIKASASEIKINSRARSAIMRIGEKIK